MIEEILNLKNKYHNDNDLGKEVRKYLNDTEISDFKDKYIRLFAEFDNFKKRSIKDREDIRNSTKTSVLTSILDLDNDLSIAYKQINTDKDGIELILSKIEIFLNSQGIKSIQTNTYDPDLHEVISITDGVGIIDVVSKGYSIDGKPFRFPKIILGNK